MYELERNEGPPQPPVPDSEVQPFCGFGEARCLAHLRVNVDLEYEPWKYSGMGAVGVSGGFSLRPWAILHRKAHWWTVGLYGGWYGYETPETDESDTLQGSELGRILLSTGAWPGSSKLSARFDAMVGTTILAERRHLSGLVHKPGAHFQLGIGLGNFGSLYAGTDLFADDVRVVFGLRLHGLVFAAILGAIIGNTDDDSM